MGVQMVSRGRYQEAVAVLEAVCAQYPFNKSFIAGQVRGASSQMRAHPVNKHTGSAGSRCCCDILLQHCVMRRC